MKNLFLAVFLLIVSIIFNGCDKDNVINNENGFFIGGNIVLMSEHGTPITDRSGVKVYIEGTNYESFTDQSGNWKIYNVPAGTYNIVAEKTNFGYNKFINFEYLGNANSNNFGQTLISSPTYLIDSVNLNISNQDLILTSHASNNANNLRVVLIYIGSVEPNCDSLETWDYLRQTQIYSGNNACTETFANGFFINEGFNHGDTLYFAIYPGSSIMEKYFLPSASRYIYTSGIGLTPIRFYYIIP
jgi:hypothetical protein